MVRLVTSSTEGREENDPRFITALGELTVSFGSLEEDVREAIWWILGGNEERAQIMTAGLSFSVLVEKFTSLFAQKFDHLLMPAGMAKLRADLMSINERRNKMVHALWVLDAGTGIFIAERKRAKPGVGIDLQSIDVPLTDIEALLGDIAKAQERVFDLVQTGDDAFKTLGPRRNR